MASHSSDDSRNIETPRLILRRFTAEDWSGFQSLAEDFNSSGGGKYEGKWPISPEHCKKSVEFMAANSKFYACCLRSTEELIGMLVLNGMDGNAQMDLGYIFFVERQDNDHDREAIEAIIGHIFREEGAASIVVQWPPEWKEQFVVPKAMGFKPVKKLKGEMVLTKKQWA